MSGFIERAIMYSLTIFYSITVFISQCILLFKLRTRFFLVKRRETPPALLNNPDFGTHHTIQLPGDGRNRGINLHYVSKGDPNGKIILFCHGFPECWFSWRYQLKYFGSKSGFLAIAPDLRGYGDSDKPKGIANYNVDLITSDLVQLIHEIWKGRQGEPIVHCLVGHDWGGFIAWRLTADYPQLINKLIIMNAPHPRVFKKFMNKSWKQFKASWYIFFFQCPYLPEIQMLMDDLKVFELIFRSGGGHALSESTTQGSQNSTEVVKNATPEEIECYKYYFGRPGAMTGPINYYRANFSKPKPFPEKIDTPTLVIWGRKDAYLMEELARSEEYVTNFRYKYIDEGTHFVQFSHPDEVNELISEFVN